MPEDEFDQGVVPAQQAIGRVFSVRGPIALVLLDGSPNSGGAGADAEIGTLVRIDTGRNLIYGILSTLEARSPGEGGAPLEGRIAEVELIGERLATEDGGHGRFHRGLTFHPRLDSVVVIAGRDDLERIFSITSDDAVEVGRLYQDPGIPAKLRVNEFLGKHFAVLGSTGTGKSCTIALILQSLLERCPNAHILLLDAHAEYASALGDRAEVITAADLRLPFWILTFDELVEVLFPNSEDYTAEIEAMADLVRQAKAMYGSQAQASGSGSTVFRRRSHDVAAFSENAALRYNMGDLIRLIDERMGALEHNSDISLYRRIRSRVDARIHDERFSFMFSMESAETSLSQVLSRLFRLPVAGRPIAILELAGLPAEVLSVLVSVTSRLAFDFGLRSGGAIPITYICEEAHNYIPSDAAQGFQPARRSIAKVAKEGRKYGISLGIVTQRPSELDATILSQCNTLISMRLTNDRDQEIVRSAVSDSASSIVRFLPSLVTGEAIAFGEGVALPLRLKFREVDAHRRPASSSADFTTGWSEDWAGDDDAERIADMLSRNTMVTPVECPSTRLGFPDRRGRGGATGAAEAGLDERARLARGEGVARAAEPAREIPAPRPAAPARLEAEMIAEFDADYAAEVSFDPNTQQPRRAEPHLPAGSGGALFDRRRGPHRR